MIGATFGRVEASIFCGIVNAEMETVEVRRGETETKRSYRATVFKDFKKELVGEADNARFCWFFNCD